MICLSLETSELKSRALIIGLGGHCASVIGVVESVGSYEIIGLIETGKKADLNEEKLGYPVIGTLQDLLINESSHSDCKLFIAVGDNVIRKEIYLKLANRYDLPSLRASSSTVHRSVKMGKGNVVGHNVLINANAEIGDNNIINSNSTVEHHAAIASHCHIAPSATLCGNTSVDSMSLIGAGAILLPNISIPASSTVGAGAVVTNSFSEEGGTYYGSPAKERFK